MFAREPQIHQVGHSCVAPLSHKKSQEIRQLRRNSLTKFLTPLRSSHGLLQATSAIVRYYSATGILACPKLLILQVVVSEEGVTGRSASLATS